MKQAEYYIGQPSYFLLEDLRKKIHIEETSSDEISDFILKNKISISSYVKGFKDDVWVPIIYHLCKYEKYQDVIKFLSKKKLNFALPPDGEMSENIFFYCHGSYLKFLYDKGCRVLKRDLNYSIIKRLKCADVKRLETLIKLNVITCKQVIEADSDVIFSSLEWLKAYVTYVFNFKKDITNLTAELNCAITKFLVSVESLIEWGAPVTEKTCNFACENYLHEFLALFIKYKAMTFKLRPVYHERMDKIQVAMLRPMLNDRRYEQTCKVLNLKVNEEVYKLPLI